MPDILSLWKMLVTVDKHYNDAAIQQHLFEPFHRANNVGKIVGSGLGLAVVKKCLEIHNGEIYVHSEVAGETSFTIKFPQQGTVIIKSKLSSHH